MRCIFQSMRSATILASVWLLGGCAVFSADGGFNKVQTLTKERIDQDIQWVKTDEDAASVARTVESLLAKPLTVDAAVQIALLNNRALQASYADLGIAESDLVQAGRLANPGFTFGRMRRGDGIEIERSLLLPVMRLLTMPFASDIAGRHFEQTQLRVASDAVAVADATRRAYFSAVAAQETARYMQQVNTSAEASATLARKMAATGNWSKLEQAREQAFYADTALQLARAVQTRFIEREKLTQLMGLWGAQTGFKLPDRLPPLPQAPENITDAEARAMRNRLDMLMAQRELAGLASALGLSKATRFINLFDVGLMHNGYSDAPSNANGYEISIEIPLFDWGTARTAKAESRYMQAVHRSAATAVNARSEVRQAYFTYRSTYDIAKHYRDEVVPLKKRIFDAQMLRYNGMLISVFTLLADAREQVMGVHSAIEALRDYWIADSALKMAQTGRATAE